jgi:D-serine deaminase-like pyridoxal phosphate-dependent protein
MRWDVGPFPSPGPPADANLWPVSTVHDLPTPALLVDLDTFAANVATMAAAWPGSRLRPHVKAFKSTTLARRLAAAGHRAFAAATVREVVGLAAAGLGDDVLLANESLDLARLTPVVESGSARVTVAVDSPETIDAVARAGLAEVLIDVDVGLPRCGCDPGEAGQLADLARSRGLQVRGVMGYEGHLMRGPADDKAAAVESAMATLLEAHRAVGGDVVSGGGTGTWDVNRWVTELQAGSYCLMDTEYVPHAPAFAPALFLWATVISVSTKGWGVLDAGLKALGMDHGNPTVEGGECWFVSDEHITFGLRDPVRVGDRLRVIPAHVDPTVSQHERLHVLDGDEVIDVWEIDLRGW